MSGHCGRFESVGGQGERPPDPMGTRMTRRYFGNPTAIRGKANAFPNDRRHRDEGRLWPLGMSFQRGNHRHRVVLGKGYAGFPAT